jgi:murein DD-endopeptidase MepM/ murein hydrolase activator NlpD
MDICSIILMLWPLSGAAELAAGSYRLAHSVQITMRNLFSAVVCVIAVCAVAQQNTPMPRAQARAVVAHNVLTPAAVTGDELAIPVAGIEKTSLVDTWGQSRVGHLHSAIDIMAARGTPVVSAANGTVLKLFTSRAGGLTVYVADPTKTWVYYYAHLDSYAPGLQPGLHVAQGDVLGFVGTTGNASPDAPHLHFEIERLPPSGDWWRGEAVNPYPILMARGRTFDSR